MSVTKNIDGYYDIGVSVNGSGEGTSYNGTGTRKVFVSSSSGVDNTGTNDGSSALPFATPVYALTHAFRSGKPDWFLFKRGDVWTLDPVNGIPLTTASSQAIGASASEPFLIGVYGSGSRPLFKGGTNCMGLIVSNRNTNTFLAVQSIELYANVRDPNSVDFDGDKAIRANSANAISANLGRLDFLLLDDMKASYYSTNIGMICDVTNSWMKQVVINRCAISDSWNAGYTHSQGLYYNDLGTQTVPLIVNESVFDHNGWNEDLMAPQTVTIDGATGIVTWTGTNWYTGFIEGDNIVFTSGTLPLGYALNTNYNIRNLSGNTFQLSAVSGGMAATYTLGGTSITNTSVNTSVLQVGYEIWNEKAFGSLITPNTRATISSIDSASSFTITGSVCTATGSSGLVYVGNPIAFSGSGTTTAQASWRASQANGFNHNFYLDNITYFTGNITARASLEGCQIRAGGAFHNNFSCNNSFGGFIAGAGQMTWSVCSEGQGHGGLSCNGFQLPNNATGSGVRNCIISNFISNGNPIQVDGGVVGSFITDSIVYNCQTGIIDGGTSTVKTNNRVTLSSDSSNPFNYPDPTRTAATYSASLGDAGTRADFLAKCKAQSRGNWDARYTADAINNYIREGFGVPMKRVPFGMHR
jgi:hypothetical protein